MSLHQQIELQAARTPDAVAVRYAGTSLTYAELDRHANRCARYLRELGVGPDVIVGLLMERSLEMMVALLGILKAGGAYLPLDPEHPQARLDFMLDDAGVPVVLTQPGLAGKVESFTGTVLPLDLGNNVLAEYDSAPPELINEPDDLAYVIYTSGSTGQPKGCLLTHRAICNRLIWMQDMYRLTAQDRVLQKTPYTFDVSVWEFFWPLLAGATLVFARPQGHKDSHYLTAAIRQEGITVCHFVPSMLRFFLDDPQAPHCTDLREVITSGEALPFELVRRFRELLPARLHNLYGPTEAAVDVSYWECEIRPDKLVPIGRAITNIQLHVLDESRRPVPRGQEGELYIAGVGLARGYLNRPELTEERFVPNPFGEPGSRMYRTGDRVRELDDGNIDFLGRVDFQVKLRGLRIELGEVEASLRDFPGVNEAAVLVRGEEDGDPKLVAYLEPAGAAPDFREVREFVRKRLPEYMVPNIVAVLDQLPVTTHGKLDRKALPWPVASGMQASTKPADTPKTGMTDDVLQRVGGFVAGLLKCARVEEQADLFDLGATSLTLVRLAEWIRQEYGVDVPVDRFLDSPTVRGIADYVVQAGGAEAVSVVAPAPKTAADTGRLTSRIRDFIATVLGCNELADDADLFDLGATSLSLVRVAEWIRQEFGIEVPVDVFLDAPSVRGIVDYLSKQGIVDAVAAPPVDAAIAAAATASGPVLAERLAPLPAVKIRPAAYLPPYPQRFAAKPLDFTSFSAWLMLLGAEEKDGRHRYLHPSGGGLNAVRTYVAVKPDAVRGLAGGVYYFHPVAHTLHRAGDIAGISGMAFSESDRTAFDSAALAIFFVAALDAIAPIYREHTGTLVAVEAGYMGQLLMSRQAMYGLATRPVARIDFGAIEAAFGLAESERFVHCMLAGAAPAVPHSGATDRLAELQRNAPPACGAVLSHRAILNAPAQAPLSKEMMDRMHDEHRHLRDVSGLPAARRLDAGPFAWDDYRLRGCQREYESAVLPLHALGGLLTLCKPQPESAGSYLFGSPMGRPGFQLYLYVRAGRVEGLAEGAYRYDEARHALVQCCDLADAAMAQAYSPYNRKHYKASAFCLFMVARPYAGLDEDEAIHLPLLESGYLGQLLMERQAEFGLGLCPIGGMRFEVVRGSLQLPDDAVLLHSFTGGMFHQEIPAGRQTLVETAQSAAATHQPRSGELAIVGLSGRYPGAEALEGYWENLKAGVSSIAPMPADRLALLAQSSVQAVRSGGYLAQIDCFDNLLFGISPVEARVLDPQERLLLESAWACLEDAGYNAETLLRGSARVGVFIGAMWNDYQTHGAQVWERQGRVEEFSHHASLANRISFIFNFSGPSVAINTSCSSGMTALHFACESIRRGECDAALVGGVNLVSHAYHARLLETIDFLSKEDTCRPFSAQANGWILGEGVGTVLIKPADAAVRDRDHVYAVIKGSAIGHSGRTMRYGAPSAQQQERIMRQALAGAGLAPDDIDYVEAAAPGAGMADAAEMSAVKAVFGKRKTEIACHVGTVKANVGHLESASVFSQLTKVLYQLRERQLAPSLNSRPRNPLIALDGTGLSIVEQLTQWSNGDAGRPLRAMINTVGAAGSEGHLVLEEYVSGERRPDPERLAIVPLSAATEPQLRQQAQQVLDFLHRAPDTRLADVAFTLQLGRVPMAERLAFVVSNTDALRAALTAWLSGDAQHPETWRGHAERGVEAAPAADDLQALAQHWVRGGKVDWVSVGVQNGQRLSLPTYPFERVRHWIGRTSGAQADEALLPQAPAAEDHEQADAQLRERVLAHLLRLVADVTEVPMARLDADAPLESYGLTSLMIQAMNGKLEEAYGPLSKTLFFEVRTLRQLAEHFIESHREAADRLFAATQRARTVLPLPAGIRRDKPTELAARPGEGIAIVGLSGRYPKAGSLRDFWTNLTQGVDCISEIPPERWDHSRYFDSVRGKPGKTYSKWGGFIDGVDEFDPMFFGMTPREAALIDPQERLFLQTAWHAVEDAGYTRESLHTMLARRVGVFVGVMYGEYQLYPSLPQGLAVSGSYGTIANRVSYVLDLHGPSMAIDTMCSSSLTAIHLACESIRRGECSAAIGGGVCLSLHPNKYVTHAMLGMSASDGRCHSFGQGGDGFVPGEGVGAVLLKPLSAAIADGDHIYGVIKGTAVNHGGRTNGFTVPDPRAQAAMIRSALANAGVSPRTVSYIEAHGTGTELGDPIEIAGLVQAFGEQSKGDPRCAIGSAKSNIGHCESAAGIAGLTKVLLQMQHQTLVKSLHSEQLNANIDFTRTPFAVQTETAPWPRPVVQFDDGPREFPRIAGISSFGAGGANAHVVVEEYIAPDRPEMRVTADSPAAIVLSAKTAEALREMARQLRDAVAAGELADERLADAAYTLQAGREAMEFRLACLVESAAALQAKLDAWLGGEREVDGLLLGEVKRSKDTLAAFTADEDMARAIDAWIAKGKLAKLLDLWVKGLAFDWNRLYDGGGEPRPQRISLPVYPFARERYWVEPPADDKAGSAARAALLHPLVHRNTSDLLELRFSTRLTGDEFFLADHVVQGRRVLPGVAYLEMAREAVALAAGSEAGAGVRLRDVVWASPIVVNADPLEVHISLYPQPDEAIGFEVYSGDELVHSQGTAEIFEPGAGEQLDLEALQTQCTRTVLNGADCYARFAELGLAYGPAHKAIEVIHVGEGQALARLRLPACVAATGPDYALHPSLLDAGLQAVAGLAADQQHGQLALPFAVHEVEIVGRCSPQMWALITPSANSAADERVRKFDVTLCNDEGMVCVRIRGYASRVIEGRLDAGSVLMLQPEWRMQPAAGKTPDYRQRRVVLCGIGVTAEGLQDRMEGASCIALPAEEDLAGDYGNAVQRLCAEVQDILKLRPAEPVLLQVVVPAAGERQVLAGLAGVLKTARQEQPNLIGQLIAIGENEDAGSLAAKLLENTACPQDVEIRYKDGQRQVAGWQELTAVPEALVPWKAGGVYLITGGLGGLGALFAREIAQQARGATLVLTGRRELDDAGRQQIRTLEELGVTVAYRAVDVADRQAVRQLVRQIQEQHHGLHGIVHAAGVLRDSLLLKKTAGEVEAVLAPKVDGLINLDEASRELELDWLICFSSAGAVLGNVGQADYAAANGFMDRFAHYRNGLAAQGLRHGQTVSVNWPLWQEGGMKIDAASVQRMEQLTGLQPLLAANGMTALYRALGTGLCQMMVFEGVPAKVRRWLAALAAPAAQAESPLPAPTVDAAQLQDKAVQYFKRLLSSIFKLPADRIEPDAPLERYGIDSILVVELTAELEKTFGPLSKTLLFEYQTLDALVGYFLSHHAERLAGLLKPALTGSSVRPAKLAAEASQSVPPMHRRRSRLAVSPLRQERRATPGAGTNPGIAIIGVAGRYPKARDLQDFWKNLRDGKDCVTEVPPERWDHSRYFDPDKNKPGTTYSKWGGFIDGVDEFDPQFFNISPREAEFTDPQERLFLQCVHAALEDAGYTRESLGQCSRERNIGVFAGVFFEEYQLYGAQEQTKGIHLALGGSPSSIANRVSYYFNLHGPSLAVDSMCSGSLTAIHLACENLLHGKCDLAIAGGVNVTIHPNKYLLLAQGKFASSKGRCESFGEGGDGYVPAEGVGTVILKPLERAIADGDQIYGVIKSTAINHGGRTNGYTVPNPHAQGEVVSRALKESGIDPRTISYIEAHGTGTALGDPIEIAGLSKAFGEFTQDRQFCAIGSVKSNIGHGESVAGIAGVTKVLLQMKHGQLAPSLHAQTLNPNIDFAATPFVVQRELTEWKRPVLDIDGRQVEFPRRAGVSSFGAGGSNAHVLIEEYVASSPVQNQAASEGPALIVLSARNMERLQERVRQLLDTIDHGWEDDSLADLAYTLQVGREAMDERLALLASSMAELKEKLAAYLAGQDGIEDLYRGQVKRNKEALAAFTADEDLAGAIDAWIAKGKLHKLLDLWVKGLAFDWNKLYGEQKPRRISLPTYPFARERYWVPQFPEQAPAQVPGQLPMLHPLVQRNTSRLAEQRFSSRLTGEEFFLAGHLVQGKRVLPGVAYLEMAREALVQAEAFATAATGVRLKNVVWARPVIVEDTPIEVHIGLHLEADGRIGYEVYSGEGDVHSQGVAEALAETPDRLDLATVRAQCMRGTLEADACYAGFAALGLAYGPAFQAIERIHVGDGMALARLQLPAGVATTAPDYVLHPSLLDAALQAVAGLAGERQGQLALPFAVAEVEIAARCGAQMWALVKPSAANGRVRHYDITLCDHDGMVAVRLKGFASRLVEGQLGAGSVLLLQPAWQPQAATGQAPDYQERHVVLCGTGITASAVQEQLGVHCIDLPAGNDLVADYSHAAQRLCAEVQAILQRKPAAPVLLQMVVPAQGERQVLAGLAGLLKTARQEQPKLVGQLIAIDDNDDAPSLAAKLADNAACPQDVAIRYLDGQRHVAGWQELAAAPEALAPWKAGGVYLITGGLGGLGKLFALEIARQARGATLVLTGRRELDDAGRQHLRALEALGATVDYRALDVADRQAVRQLVLQVQEDHQALHGIVHAAGVLRDSLLLKKTAGEVEAVLAPKVAGLIHLDEASRDIELDWLICFSSTSAALGNVGQADYAAANGFMDSFAHYRNGLAAQGLRHGRTVSVNWPLWQEGGMRMDSASAQRLEQLTGLQALDSESGIAALYGVLHAGLAQAMVLQGAPGKIRHQLLAKPESAPVRTKERATTVAVEAAPAETGAGLLQERIRRALDNAVSTLLKIKPDDIDGDAELSEFGFDSVTLTEFGNRLNQDYRIALTPTIFFEYPTLNSFAEYLGKEHREAFAAKLLAKEEVRPSAVIAAPASEAVVPRSRAARRASLSSVAAADSGAAPARATASEPVAIIGMSGSFPMARDLQDFWDNLLGEKDCISEVPAGRWDWRQLYGDPATEENKTNVKWGGFIDGVDEFDPLFFGISPKEAEVMDPQQRLLMMHVWKAIEDAGYAAGSLSGSRTAIYVGTGSSGYGSLLEQANLAIEGYSATAMVPSVGPNRMSYLLNLHGPSEPVETACSSSLVALRKGVVAIESGGCDMAIVGGVNTIVTPAAHISFSKAGMLAEDGRCKTFSAQANGYVRGEGVGMLVLKRLSAAERDGDHIYGVIRGTSENHGGRATSLTAPNPKAQAELLKDAYASAGVDPRSIGYIEAHGTGTPLGDPIEVNGLKMAFKALYQDEGVEAPAEPHCGLGSVKANIGHLELAAGVAGVIKVLLQLQHRTLVKSLHCDEVNPYIDLQQSPFYLVRQTRDWETLRDAQGHQLPRRAGVSSFGFGGVNAHVVIEEYLASPNARTPRQVTPDNPALVVLSAKNADRLREQAQQLLAAIERNAWGDDQLADLAYTLQVGREAMEERLALLAGSMAQLKEKLTAFVAGHNAIDDLFRGQVKRNKEALAVFSADDELQEAVAKWVARKKFAKVLDLWVKGMVFNWNTLYDESGEYRPKRMSLPTYPFARERYWVPETEANRAGGHAVRAAGKDPHPVQQVKAGFDEAYYLQLLDQVMDGSVSVEAAARQIDANE